jgi:hypothetical protein
MLVSEDSPLRHLPTVVELSQTMFLDGIRFSLDMADESFLACVRALDALSSAGEHSPLNTVIAFQSAWGFVDAVNRLRVLLTAMRGVKRTPQLRVFLSKLEPMKELRNGVQHLDGTIRTLSNQGEPTWGSLSWVVPPQPESNIMSIFLCIPGSVRDWDRPAVNPVGQQIAVPLGLIELTAFGTTVSLSDVHAGLVGFVPGFESAAAAAFAGRGATRAADVLAEMQITPVDDPAAGQASETPGPND